MKTCCGTIRKRLDILRQLRSSSHAWLLLRIFLVAAFVPVLFRLRLPLLNQLLESRFKSLVSAQARLCDEEQIIQCVEWAITLGWPVIRPRCLTRGFTRYYFLRCIGIELSLCFGAARRNGELIPAPGHCWLLKDGVPYLEPVEPNVNFVPIYWLPACPPNPLKKSG
jgi:hypothetical protein